MTPRRFWLLMGLTLAACTLFLAAETLMALVVAVAILLASLWPQKRRRS
jgi:hypothetical protein